LYDPTTGFDIRNGATVKTYFGVKHEDLVKNSDILKAAIAFYGSNNNTFQNSVPQFALQSVPATSNGTEIEIQGSAGGYILDSANNKSGQDDSLGGLVLLNIPSSYYYAIGDTQSYFFENSDTYHTKLNSIGDGLSQIHIVNYVNDDMMQEAYFDVNEPAGAQMSLDVGTGQNLSNLQLNIDVDANGTIDQTQQPTG